MPPYTTYVSYLCGLGGDVPLRSSARRSRARPTPTHASLSSFNGLAGVVPRPQHRPETLDFWAHLAALDPERIIARAHRVRGQVHDGGV
jgi:hypothetical protein